MSGRSALRITRAARPLFSATARPAAVAFPASRRAFGVTSTRSKNSGVIHESEVPISVYSPDAKGAASGSIPVSRSAGGKPGPINPEEDGDVTPLTEQVYRNMPPTLQKMSVMGKVVIITG